jgi:hypothetical protein
MLRRVAIWYKVAELLTASIIDLTTEAVNTSETSVPDYMAKHPKDRPVDIRHRYNLKTDP